MRFRDRVTRFLEDGRVGGVECSEVAAQHSATCVERKRRRLGETSLFIRPILNLAHLFYQYLINLELACSIYSTVI